ncbi:MAG: hypothetical protein GX661_01520, partial [Acholeplasmataceae bacterium]|nr:hypothetical protein [Acholeplasmataceae bacterium]
MSTYQAFLKDYVDGLGVIQTQDLVFSDAFLDACKMNRCGKYCKSWFCPPAITQDLIMQYLKYQKILIISKISTLEDPFDLEGMDRGRKEIQNILYRFQNAFPNESYRI